MAHAEKFLTVKDVARMLRVSVATVWRYAQRGTLPEPIRIDGHTWWIEAEVLAVIEKKKAARRKPLPANDPLPRQRTAKIRKKRRRVRLEDAA